MFKILFSCFKFGDSFYEMKDAINMTDKAGLRAFGWFMYAALYLAWLIVLAGVVFLVVSFFGKSYILSRAIVMLVIGIIMLLMAAAMWKKILE